MMKPETNPITINGLKSIKTYTDKLYNIDDFLNEYSIRKLVDHQNSIMGCPTCHTCEENKPNLNIYNTVLETLNTDLIPYNIFMTLNASIFMLTAFVVLIGIISFFIPKTPKGVSILNTLTAFMLFLFLLLLPIPLIKTEFAPIMGLEYTPLCYLFALCGGVHIISFLAINNKVTFIKDNTQIEYPLLITLLYYTSFILISATNWLIILISLEAITFIVAVLVAFQRNNSLTSSAAIRYIIFSAIPSGLLILGISEYYSFFGTFDLYDLEKLQLVPNIEMDINQQDALKETLFRILFKECVYEDLAPQAEVENFYYETLMRHRPRSYLLQKFERSALFIEEVTKLESVNPMLAFIIKQVTGWQHFTTTVSVYNKDTEEFVFGPNKSIVDLNILINDLKSFSLLGPSLNDQEKLLIDFFYDALYKNPSPHFLQTTTFDILNQFQGIFNKEVDRELAKTNFPLYLKNEHEAVDKYCLEGKFFGKDKDFVRKLLVFKKFILQLEESTPTIAVYSGSKTVSDYTIEKDITNTLSHWRLKYIDPSTGEWVNFNLSDDVLWDSFSFWYDNVHKPELYNLDIKQVSKETIHLVSLNHNNDTQTIIIVALFLILFNILFKLTAAPLHFWAPLVYESAPLPITMFLSIFTKITMIFFLMKVITCTIPLYDLSWVNLLLFCGIGSIIAGVVGAISETKIKRFFVYSSMGHVGFMLLGLSSGNVDSFTSTIMYLIIYMVSAFMLWLILLASKKPIIYLTQLSGLSKTNPMVSLILSISLLSMSGIPPLAGFYVKFNILLCLVESSYHLVAFITLLLTIISFFYYLRIIKILYFEPTKNFKISFKFTLIQATILSLYFFILVGYCFLFPVGFYDLLRGALEAYISS